MTVLPIVPNWTCAKSGDCCQGPELVVTRQELAAMQTARPSVDVHIRAMDDPRFVTLLGEPCPYWASDTKLCTVYEARPTNCRRFACYRAEGEPFLKGGPMGCLNLSVRVQQNRGVRRDYARRQRQAQRWAVKHGWTA